MIEGTPQLHANAWKVSSACSMPINIPVVDPCNVNQQNGMFSYESLELAVSYYYRIVFVFSVKKFHIHVFHVFQLQV